MLMQFRAMKLFARLFFISGALLGIYIAVYPTALKFVAVPAGTLEAGMHGKDHGTVSAPAVVRHVVSTPPTAD